MSLSASEIAAVVAELQVLREGVVQKAFCPEPKAVLLEIRQPGATLRLYLCAETDRTRIHLVEKRPPSPPRPFAFQGLLRKEIVGRRIAGLHTVPGDRVVSIDFEAKGVRRVLIAELTGRHGNLFALNGDGVVLGQAAEDLSSARANAPGKAYVFPTLSASPRAGRRRFEPSVETFSLSRAIADAYASIDHEALTVQLRRRLIEPLKRQKERLERTMAKVRAEANRAAGAEAHRRHGELLVRNLHRVKRGAERAEIQEYDADGERTVLVPLDPSISPKENAERHFRLYRRLTRGAKRASERLSTLERMHGDLEAAIERVEKAAPHQLVPLGSRTKRVRPASHTRKAETATKPYREFRAEDETRVWVGRTAAGNDELTFRHARGNEFWLHARNVTGAHVVMKTEAADPPSETLLDAATLAAHFSDARGEPLVEISWTRAKYVHKAKGAPPGSVAMSHEHTLRVRIEATRLERLLATRDTRDAPSRSTP